MAKAKQQSPKKRTSTESTTTTEPKFPYTTTPNTLRSFLKLVPEKPKPPKVNNQLLQSWGFGDSNANSIIRVLKTVNLVDSSNGVTPHYESFMQPSVGPSELGDLIRATYEPLFIASHAPYKDNEEELRRLFNIHSGGSEATIKMQVSTFKVLCEFATFNGAGATSQQSLGTSAMLGSSAAQTPSGHTPPGSPSVPTIHIDLHIHLPENKTTREYQAIIEDIGHISFRTRANQMASEWVNRQVALCESVGALREKYSTPHDSEAGLPKVSADSIIAALGQFQECVRVPEH